MKIARLGMVLLLAASTLVMPACKKKSEDPQPEEETPVTPVVTYGSFSAKVDGTSKSYPVNYYITNSGMSVISGTETGGTSISLSLFSTAVGSQDIDGIFTSASYIVGTTSKSAASGKIAITKIGNNKISVNI